MRRILPLVIASFLALIAPSAAYAGPGGGQGTSGNNATSWYLAMGDSLAAGYQPGMGDDRSGGYVGGVLDALQEDGAKAKLRNISCSGATTTSLMGTDRCAYEAGSQLAAGIEFLKAHKSKVDLVTIDIGANDVTPCLKAADLATCAFGAVGTVHANLTTILGQLRAATGPDTQIIVLNYYNPFLAAYLLPGGQQLATLTTGLQGSLNAAVTGAAATAQADVADVATAFKSTDTTPVSTAAYGTIPTNVATICAWTWMCAKNDIHANDAGYAVLAQTVAARLE